MCGQCFEKYPGGCADLGKTKAIELLEEMDGQN